MRYLITGGCGFLGSNLAHEVLMRGDELCIFDNLSRFGSVQNLAWLQESGNFTFQHGDIRNQGDVARAITSFRPDVIFHLAGQVAMTTSIANPRLDFEVNAIGTLNLLEAVRQNTPDAVIVYSSTNKVYGDLVQYQYQETDTRFQCLEKPYGFDESTPLDMRSPYGCSKGAADQYMLDYARTFGLRTIVFRHSSMYGGRQFASYDQGWIGWFCQKALETKRGSSGDLFSISGNGKQVRDILHADDMKKLYFAAVDHAEKAKGQIFNVGGGILNSMSLLELFTLLENLLSIKLSYSMNEWRQSDQKVFVADISKARTLLDWTPKINSLEGIEGMLRWLGLSRGFDK